MFITIGATNYNGDPIVHNREDMTKEVLFDLLTTATVTNLPALSSEEYYSVNKAYDALHSELGSISDRLPSNLRDVFQGLHDVLWTAVDQAYECGFKDGQDYYNRMECMQEQQAHALAARQEQSAAELPPISEDERPFWDELYGKLSAYADQEGISLMDAAQQFADGFKAQQMECGADQAAGTIDTDEKEHIAESWVEAQETYCNYFDTYMDTFSLNIVQSLGLRQLCDFAEAFTREDVAAKAAGINTEEMLQLYNDLMVRCWGPDWRAEKDTQDQKGA